MTKECFENLIKYGSSVSNLILEEINNLQSLNEDYNLIFSHLRLLTDNYNFNFEEFLKIHDIYYKHVVRESMIVCIACNDRPKLLDLINSLDPLNDAFCLFDRTKKVFTNIPKTLCSSILEEYKGKIISKGDDYFEGRKSN